MMNDVQRTPVRPKRRRRKTLYFTSEKKRFRLSVGKKNANNEGKRNLLRTVEETVKTLNFDAMEDDEGAKSKEDVDDHISKSKLKTGSKKTTNKKVSQFNVHLICSLTCHVLVIYRGYKLERTWYITKI
jgi:hypothetical protein